MVSQSGIFFALKSTENVVLRPFVKTQESGRTPQKTKCKIAKLHEIERQMGKDGCGSPRAVSQRCSTVFEKVGKPMQWPHTARGEHMTLARVLIHFRLIWRPNEVASFSRGACIFFAPPIGTAHRCHLGHPKITVFVCFYLSEEKLAVSDIYDGTAAQTPNEWCSYRCESIP